MTSYRIKVFPHKGTLYYMPQQKSWFRWVDKFRCYVNGCYHDYQLVYMKSEASCLAFINDVKERNEDYDDKQAQIKKFERDNPVTYLNVVFINEKGES